MGEDGDRAGPGGESTPEPGGGAQPGSGSADAPGPVAQPGPEAPQDPGADSPWTPSSPGAGQWGSREGQPPAGQPSWAPPPGAGGWQPPPGQPATPPPPPPGQGGWQAPPPPPPGQGGWQASPGQPPPYPGYGYPQQYGGAPVPVARPNAGSAIAVAVFGVGSIVVLFTCLIGFIPAIIALVMAPGARREIEQSGGRLGGEGLIQAGKICSWITLGLTGLALVLAVVGLIVAVSVGGMSGGGTPALGL